MKIGFFKKSKNSSAALSRWRSFAYWLIPPPVGGPGRAGRNLFSSISQNLIEGKTIIKFGKKMVWLRSVAVAPFSFVYWLIPSSVGGFGRAKRNLILRISQNLLEIKSNKFEIENSMKEWKT